MKALIASIIAFAIVVAGWSIFENYSDKTIHAMMNTIEDDILVDVYSGDWNKAEDQFQALSAEWHERKNTYSFFFNTIDLNSTDYAIARAESYIHAKDTPLAAGELNCIKEQLGFLHKNELVSFDNLF